METLHFPYWHGCLTAMSLYPRVQVFRSFRRPITDNSLFTFLFLAIATDNPIPLHPPLTDWHVFVAVPPAHAPSLLLTETFCDAMPQPHHRTFLTLRLYTATVCQRWKNFKDWKELSQLSACCVSVRPWIREKAEHCGHAGAIGEADPRVSLSESLAKSTRSRPVRDPGSKEMMVPWRSTRLTSNMSDMCTHTTWAWAQPWACTQTYTYICLHTNIHIHMHPWELLWSHNMDYQRTLSLSLSSAFRSLYKHICWRDSGGRCFGNGNDYQTGSGYWIRSCRDTWPLFLGSLRNDENKAFHWRDLEGLRCCASEHDFPRLLL